MEMWKEREYSWPPGGIRPGARVCVFSMCVLSVTLPSSYELRFP